MDQPKWLDAAWAELGQCEVVGSGDNARILRFFADVGQDAGTGDETAWCAAFVGACLERGGFASSRSLLARSYLDWGTPAQVVQLGAVAVLSRGSNTAQGHVGFVVGETDGKIVLLGGNQSDAVTVQAFAKERLLGIRWPGNLAASTRDNEIDHDIFDEALAHVLEMEGGFTDDPYDPGGPTNYGIILEVFADWRGEKIDASNLAALRWDLQQIAPETVRSIYLARYWRPARCAELPPLLAVMHFDAAVNHGVTGAAKFLQKAVGAEIDGEVGPLTLAAAARVEALAAVRTYADLRRARYRALPHFWRFGRGWLARVDKTLARAIEIAAAAPADANPSAQKGTTVMDIKSTLETSVPAADDTGKWWGNSVTIWGALISGLSVVLPALGPALGLDLTTEIVRQLGEQVATAFQAVAAVCGTLLAIYGRIRASQPIVRRAVNLKL